MSLKELKEVFDATYTGTEKQNEEIYRELMTREEINELIMTEDCIEMAYHLFVLRLKWMARNTIML